MKRILTDEKTWEKCHVLRMLEAHSGQEHYSFHTPGHKANGYDITELAYSDNLSCPQGVIALAERDIAEILGADGSFILTDGSTSGVLSMLYALRESGVKKVAAPILSHKSFWNGCMLLGLTPVTFETPTNALPCKLTAKDVFEAVNGADALFLTSPDYYGNVAQLAEIKSLCAAQGKPLIIDGAHGGHLHADKDRYAGAYADMWVDGVHKSLPALTQGAVVSAKGSFVEKLKQAVDIFRTTSPSYPIMGSVEYAVKFPTNEGLERAVNEWKHSLAYCYNSDDYTKICLFVKDGFEAEKTAQSKGIYPEFSEENVLCFYLSPAQTEKDFLRLKNFVLELDKAGVLLPEKDVKCVHAPLLLQDIEGMAVEKVPLLESVGRICAQVCGLFPPCLPLIRKGEIITAEKVNALMGASNRFGIENDTIKVVETCKESL